MKTLEFIEKIIEEKSTVSSRPTIKSGNLPNWHIMNISLPGCSANF